MAVTLATCGYDDVQTFSWAGQSIACKVVHVHDGDTLYVALEHPQTGHLIKFKVRLANINAFELQTEGGVSGRNALIAWITGEHSDTVEVKCNDRKAIHRLLKERSPLLWIELMDYDKFGRILGILKKHQDDAYDKSANAMMVQMGFAKCYMESY